MITLLGALTGLALAVFGAWAERGDNGSRA